MMFTASRSVVINKWIYPPYLEKRVPRYPESKLNNEESCVVVEDGCVFASYFFPDKALTGVLNKALRRFGLRVNPVHL
jgi:hypothetical protein